MDNNTLMAIIFCFGTLVVLLLRVIINKSMFNYKGEENKNIEVFNSNVALTVNSALTFLMFIAIMIYDGCNKDLEAEYKARYENVDQYLEKERLKAKQETLDELQKILMQPK
jgi:hypothetical protein